MKKSTLSILVLLFIYLYLSTFIPYIDTNGLAVCAVSVLAGSLYFIDRRFPPKQKLSEELIKLDEELKAKQMKLALYKTDSEYNRQMTMTSLDKENKKQVRF